MKGGHGWKKAGLSCKEEKSLGIKSERDYDAQVCFWLWDERKRETLWTMASLRAKEREKCKVYTDWDGERPRGYLLIAGALDSFLMPLSAKLLSSRSIQKPIKFVSRKQISFNPFPNICLVSEEKKRKSGLLQNFLLPRIYPDFIGRKTARGKEKKNAGLAQRFRRRRRVGFSPETSSLAKPQTYFLSNKKRSQ